MKKFRTVKTVIRWITCEKQGQQSKGSWISCDKVDFKLSVYKCCDKGDKV